MDWCLSLCACVFVRVFFNFHFRFDISTASMWLLPWLRILWCQKTLCSHAKWKMFSKRTHSNSTNQSTIDELHFTKFTKTLVHSHIHTHGGERGIDTPNCGKKIILSLCYCYTVFFSPHLICQLFRNFLFCSFFSFRVFFSLRVQTSYSSSFFSFSPTKLHVVYLLFNMGQRINCCWWLDIVWERLKNQYTHRRMFERNTEIIQQ